MHLRSPSPSVGFQCLHEFQHMRLGEVMHELVLVVSTAVTSQLPKRLTLVKITLASTKYTKNF